MVGTQAGRDIDRGASATTGLPSGHSLQHVLRCSLSLVLPDLIFQHAYPTPVCEATSAGAVSTAGSCDLTPCF
jgi:hypothetical protein